MGNRLSRLYTRTGDKGTTGLGDGSRVPKSGPRIEAIGDIDELNSALGVVLAQTLPGDLRARLTPLQHRLFDAGGEISMPGTSLILAEDVEGLEEALDDLNQRVPPLREFIMPGGGSPAAAHCHMARAICRRAERTVVALNDAEPVNVQTMRFLNRLSDLLFVTARLLARAENGEEILWEPRHRGDGEAGNGDRA